MHKNNIVSPENLVYAKPEIMNNNYMHYCPGCSHGVVHKVIAEVIQELGLQEKTIGIAPVGCAVFAYKYLDIDWQEAAHGRAPALATAVKRLLPERWSSHIRVMVTLPQLAQQKPYTLQIVAKILQSSS